MKKYLLILFIVVFMTGLTACGGGNSNQAGNTAAGSDTATGNDSAAGNGANSEQEISGEITVFGWGGGEELQSRKDATKVFKKLYPKVKVNEVWLPADNVDVKLDAALAAGNAGDVIMMSPDWKGLRTKWFEDLNPYIERDQLDLEALFTEGVDGGYVDPDGKREGMPATASDFMIAYNKEIFDKAGVPYPTNDWTWDDFANIAKQVSSGEGANRIYGIVSHWILQSFAPFVYGGAPYNEDWTKQTLDDENTLKGYQLFGDLVKAKAMPDDAAAKSMPMDQMFAAGKAAMYPLGLFEASTIAKNIGSNFEWGIVMPPKDPSGKTVNIKFQTGFAMNKDSKNKEAAWAYIKTVSLNKEVGDLYSKVNLPALKESADATFANLKIEGTDIAMLDFVTGLQDAITFPWGGSIAKAGDLYEQVWQEVTVQGKSAEEAAGAFASQIQAAFDSIHQSK
ncbi:sugar ABC transporter substrate-binding protein [Paenibacillus barengoltzii]|uniref:ABC transporter substrate-binding protein n=1 Tax=Paenibacillus barengoltzii TaxID=343517 RepID=UPI002DB8EFA7|nr:sugar ABC transporter substrate-binding protein [Paenibacillus barengoltzii]MEC2342586.1 sugar ABC transporter substrate-binding protein [Paenibacillus barengoltzii]